MKMSKSSTQRETRYAYTCIFVFIQGKENLLGTILQWMDPVDPCHRWVQSILVVTHPCIKFIADENIKMDNRRDHFEA